MATASHISPVAGNALSAPTAIIDLIKSRFAKYRLYHQTLAELQSLGERELADLGLNRSMLKRVAYQAAYDLA